MTRREAERRARQIHAFRAELTELEKGGVLALSEGEAARVRSYHDDLLVRFAGRFDTDLDAGEERLSWGMRIVSTLGAIALSLAVFLFFRHYWNDLSTALQTALAIAAPILGLAATEWVARRFGTRHFTQLAALVTIACFALNLYLLSKIFNITPSPAAIFLAGLFAVLLAVRHQLDALLAIGLFAIGLFAAALLTQLSGYYWMQVFISEFYLGGFLLLLLASLLPLCFIMINRLIFFNTALFGIFLMLLGIVTLAFDSLLPFSEAVRGWIYLFVALVAGALALAFSIRADWGQGAYMSAGFLIVVLVIKYFDWFWDRWPAYIFFLILGLLAVGVILCLRMLRREGRQGHGAV